MRNLVFLQRTGPWMLRAVERLLQRPDGMSQGTKPGPNRRAVELNKVRPYDCAFCFRGRSCVRTRRSFAPSFQFEGVRCDFVR